MKMSPVRRRRKDQGGNILVEFALMATVLLMITFGVTDFARVLSEGDVGASAALAGAFYGMMSPAHGGDITGMQNAAIAAAPSGWGLTATASQFCTCSVGGAHSTCPATCTGAGESSQMWVQVDTTIPFSTLVSMPGLPNTVSVNNRAILPVQ